LKPLSVTFLSQHFWPEDTATSEMLSGVAFALSESGMNVSAISGQPVYRKDTPKLSTKLEHQNVKVIRVFSTRFDKNRPLGRIINMMSFTISLFFKILTMPRCDILIAVTNPPTLLWVARVLLFLRKIPSILIVHDVYPQIISALG